MRRTIGATFCLAAFALGTTSAYRSNGSAPPLQAEEGFIELFDDKDFIDRKLTVKLGQDVPNLKDIASDDGEKGFGDKASSVRWKIPVGKKAVLYDDADYKDRTLELVGTGKLEQKANFDQEKFNDKASSVRWLKSE